MARCLRCARDFPTGEDACHTCGLTFPPAPSVTTRRRGKPPPLPRKYEIVRFLGRGAMGRVYQILKRTSHISVVLRERKDDKNERKREPKKQEQS